MAEPTQAAAAAQAASSQGDIETLKARLRAEEKKLALVQEIGQALSSVLDLDRLLALIMEKITILMEADRSTLYLFSDDGQMLWSKIAQAGGGAHTEIRLKVGEGIAGWVAASGETVNIEDAYVDTRFQPAVDLRSGYRTRSILCMPMRNNLGATIGVVQVLNKQDGPFTRDDEGLLAALASQAAVAIENSKLYHSIVGKNLQLLETQEQLQQKSADLNLLYTIEKEMNEAADLDEVLDRLIRRAMELVGADAGSIVLREKGTDALYFRSVAGEAGEKVKRLRVPMGQGVVGWVAANKRPLIVNEPRKDARHDAEAAARVGHRPDNLVAVPLVDSEGETLGALELLDKLDDDGFSDNDLKLLSLIAGQASKAIQLARAKEERAKESQLASIGQIVSGVLHDLKTPMTIVSGYAQLMAAMDDAQQRGQYVEHILKQFDHMSAMTREVLQFARGESNVLVRKVFLHKFIEEIAAQLVHEFAGRKIELVIDAQWKGAAYFDEQKMTRVIHNLARNAAQAMPDGGTFTFRITRDLAAGKLLMEFADTGTGIPVEMEGRLFQLFATSGKKDGTGLGLAIVKKIVDEHKGEITYESSTEGGTRFKIALPLERQTSSPGVGDESQG